MPYTNVTPAWLASLTAGTLTIALCLRIVPTRALPSALTEIDITSHQRPITLPQLTFGVSPQPVVVIPGATYGSNPPFIAKNIESSEDIGEQDNWEIDIAEGNGILAEDVANDCYDQASWSLIAVNYLNIDSTAQVCSSANSSGIGGQLIKTGTIQNARVSGPRITFEFAGEAFGLQQAIIDQIQPTCRNQFGVNDGVISLCPYNLAGTIPSAANGGNAGYASTVTGTVSASPAPTSTSFTATGGGSYPVSGYLANIFYKGIATCLTATNVGNVGIAVEIQTSNSGAFVLREPMPYAITSGDTFSLSVGCNKVINTCVNYGQVPFFQGEDEVPSLISMGFVN